MAGRGMFGRLTGAFQGDKKKDETHADIIAELKQEVQAIRESKREVIGGDSVFSQSWGDAGDLIYIINLVPMYALIGGREGRLAESLRATCKTEFAENTGGKRGRGTFERDCFFMRFYNLGDQAGLQEAVKIVNKIGYRTFGESFRTMEVPELLVAADAADITTHGELDTSKAKDVIAKGGVDLNFAEPAEKAPRWMRLIWQKVTSKPKVAEVEKTKRKDPKWEAASPPSAQRKKPSEPIWVQSKVEKEKRTSRDHVKRGADRRKVQRAYEGSNRRITFDRRGRGY